MLLTPASGLRRNVAIFSVANAVLFGDELAFVWNRLPATNVSRALLSGPDFRDY